MMLNFRPFPESFCLKNLPNISAQACALKRNLRGKDIAEDMIHWFHRFKLNRKESSEDYTRRGKFEALAEYGFPDADEEHLKTCLAFLIWAFAIDDLSDEGDLQSKPELVEASINLCREALYDLDKDSSYPYASMLQDFFRKVKATATPGTCRRFIAAYEAFSKSEIVQSRERSLYSIPSVADLITIRRGSIGAAMAEAIIEYSLDIDLPDYVFDNDTMKEISMIVADLMTIPNDLCSFNKEQADNDFQNLVCCVMVEQNVELQDAFDILTDMLECCVSKYLDLKESLPSFGEAVDAQLAKYLSGVEYFLQGTTVWYYRSPRYFSNKDRRTALKKDQMTIKLRCPNP